MWVLGGHMDAECDRSTAGIAPRPPRRAGRVLEVFCACGHHARIDPAQTTWPDKFAVPHAHRLMRCSGCGKRPDHSRLDALVKGVAGQYPQF